MFIQILHHFLSLRIAGTVSLNNVRFQIVASFRNEVEDFPLFEDRKSGPSQLFGSIETSLSDMKVNSPQSFKKIVDGDEDIKPNTYHDFGEASI